MSAMVINLNTYRREGKSDEQRARERVGEQLAGQCTGTIIAQAKARAVRSIVGGRNLDEAVYCAVAWALYADHPDAEPGSAQ